MFLSYSRIFLREIWRSSSQISLKPALWRHLSTLGTTRVKSTRRGKRAGLYLKLRDSRPAKIHFSELSNVNNGSDNSVYPGLENDSRHDSNLHVVKINK